MKCSIIRDLLPIYDSRNCREETKKVVAEHLISCASCKKLYEEMDEEVGLQDSIKLQQNPTKDNEFWSKYYGNLLKKGLIIFLCVYSVFIFIQILLKPHS